MNWGEGSLLAPGDVECWQAAERRDVIVLDDLRKQHALAQGPLDMLHDAGLRGQDVVLLAVLVLDRGDLVSVRDGVALLHCVAHERETVHVRRAVIRGSACPGSRAGVLGLPGLREVHCALRGSPGQGGKRPDSDELTVLHHGQGGALCHALLPGLHAAVVGGLELDLLAVLVLRQDDGLVLVHQVPNLHQVPLEGEVLVLGLLRPGTAPGDAVTLRQRVEVRPLDHDHGLVVKPEVQFVVVHQPVLDGHHRPGIGRHTGVRGLVGSLRHDETLSLLDLVASVGRKGDEALALASLDADLHGRLRRYVGQRGLEALLHGHRTEQGRPADKGEEAWANPGPRADAEGDLLDIPVERSDRSVLLLVSQEHGICGVVVAVSKRGGLELGRPVVQLAHLHLRVVCQMVPCESGERHKLPGLPLMGRVEIEEGQREIWHDERLHALPVQESHL
mmetsp:Transcript_51769/g.160610  ORF Transcript_51769/g.160610 Transcript_51769/m.160610 type:complete len:448 (+) Transcript_51769:718-2061(+)